MDGIMVLDSILYSIKVMCMEKQLQALKKVHLTIKHGRNITTQTIRSELQISISQVNTEKIQMIVDSLKFIDKPAIINNIEGY
jgi:hypothetical protein